MPQKEAPEDACNFAAYGGGQHNPRDRFRFLDLLQPPKHAGGPPVHPGGPWSIRSSALVWK